MSGTDLQANLLENSIRKNGPDVSSMSFPLPHSATFLRLMSAGLLSAPPAPPVPGMVYPGSPPGIPAAVDCGVRELAWQYGKSLLPERGEFKSLYEAMQAGTGSSKGWSSSSTPANSVDSRASVYALCSLTAFFLQRDGTYEGRCLCSSAPPNSR